MKKSYFIFFTILFFSCYRDDCTPKEGEPALGVRLWGECYNIEETTWLNRTHEKLKDTIPPDIGKLINLTGLDLSFNDLKGGIPPEIGNLTNLRVLDLSSNNLKGEIPPEIGNLKKLTKFKLRYNSLSGEVPPEVCDIVIGLVTGKINKTIKTEFNISHITGGQNYSFYEDCWGHYVKKLGEKIDKE